MIPGKIPPRQPRAGIWPHKLWSCVQRTQWQPPPAHVIRYAGNQTRAPKGASARLLGTSKKSSHEEYPAANPNALLVSASSWFICRAA